MRNKPTLQENTLTRLQRCARRFRARCVRVIHHRNAGALDYRFDYQSDRTVVTDSLGRTQTFQFDGEGASRRLVRYFDATGAYTDYQHNMTGALVSETNALGQVTCYDRDMQGRMRTVASPAGSQSLADFIDCSAFGS